MALDIPTYVANAGIQDSDLPYIWDGVSWNALDGVEDETYLKRVDILSGRASLALTIACAEWVIHRYDLLSSDPVPHLYVEASWAAAVDHRYLRGWEPATEEWTGRIRGPLAAALLIIKQAVKSALYELSHPSPTVAISNLAKYVLTDNRAFVQWRNRIADRLERLYLLDPDEMLGEVVPREIFDPGFLFHLDMTEVLINNFLSKLSVASNPFLNSPEEMKDLQFEGAPYLFDIKKDRFERYDW